MKISLHMIVKDEVEDVSRILGQAEFYFDKIYITVSDKKSFNELKKLPTEKTEYDYRPWNNRFDEARQHNWEKGEHMDASFWIDADDEFDFRTIEEMKPLLDEYDVVFLPYHYEHDEKGNVIVSHWRERLIKRGLGFYWKGWVHENLITDQHFTKINIGIPVVHRTKEGHREASTKRNHEILLQAYQETKDPRYIHYLGISFFTLQEFEKCIEILKEYVKVGGWDEEVYRSLVKMGEAAFMLGDYEEAMQYLTRAVGLIPSYPMAYEVLSHIEFQHNNYKEAYEWAKMALSKETPEGASIYDPTARDRTILTGALCEMQIGSHTDALELLKRVKTIDVSELIPIVKEKAKEETLRAVLPQIESLYQTPSLLWSTLKEDIKYLPEFRTTRERYTKPQKWVDNSIVFFCGKGYEEWGPHTLSKGMGGSEEAIVYLSRELVKLGYEVTVFGEVEKTIVSQGVVWEPWTRIDRRDEFATLVIWRYPQFATQFKAKKMLIDMHDQLPSELVKPYKAHYMFKTQYHKDQYPQITDYSIVGNGILPEQFKKTKKKPNSVIYASAYYRGLEKLVDMWARIKQAVPDATLDVYYGWESWVTAEGKDDFYYRMTEKLEKVKSLGVTEHGRVDHETLAKKYGESKVWAYPTEFPEIHCITALKANIAGCKPVITDVAALKETGGPQASVVETNRIYSDEYSQEQFVQHVIKALRDEHDPTEQIKWAKQFSWENVAKQWEGVIDGRD